MTLGLSHVALGGALMACLAGFGGYVHGIDVGQAREQAAQKRADDAAAAVTKKLQSQINASDERFAATEHARQSSVREIYHESQKVIERPVYRAVCVDADGVGLLDRAAGTANGTDDIIALVGDTRPIAQSPAD